MSRRFGDRDLRSWRRRWGLLEQAYEISRERLDMEQERYRLGTTSYLELQNAVDRVAERRDLDLIQNRYDYQIAWSNLAEYVDGGPGGR